MNGYGRHVSQTLGEWIGRIGVARQRLAEKLAELIRERSYLHADETPVRQLDPGSDKTKRAYVRAPPIQRARRRAVSGRDYLTGRAGAHARAVLLVWRAHLMTDDYAG